jgi:prevent-host-death family protein
MWQVQDAKAKFSELLDKTLSEGPQVVSRRGVAAAVLVPIEEWESLQRRARPSLKDLLLSDENRFEIDLPPRGKFRHRPIIRFEDE